MTTHPIAPPPSIDDILATPARDQLIGRVDFSSPLVEPEPEPVAAEPVAADPVAADPVAADPVAPDPVPVVEPKPDPAPVAVVWTDPDPEPAPEPTPIAVIEVPAPAPALAPQPVDPSLSDELAHLALSVEDIAATVVELMERAGDAHVRHLQAIETETARRCELVTAQAELDAELIRLHARREAHTILTAARARTGDGTDDHEGPELRRIGDSLSAFAESIETDVARTPPAHGHSEPS